MLVPNVLVLDTNTLKVRVQTSTPHSYTCGYQRFSSRKHLLKLLLTGTRLRKWAVAMLSYSSVSTLYPQVIYTIVFSAELNNLQVD